MEGNLGGGTPVPVEIVGTLQVPGKRENSDLALVGANTTSMVEIMTEHFSREKEVNKLQETAMESQIATNSFFMSDKNDAYLGGSRGKKKSKLDDYFQKKFVGQDWLTKSLGFFKGIAKSAAGFIIELLKFLAVMSIFGPEFLSAIIQFVISTVMMIVNMIIAALPSIVQAIATFLPIVINAVVNLINTLIPMLMDLLPKIIELLASAIIQIVDNITKILPKIIPVIVKILVTLITALTKIIPVIIKALLEAIPLIINALVEAIPLIIDALVVAIPLIVDAFVQAIPLILAALISVIPVVYDSMIKLLNQLGEKIPVLGPLFKGLAIWVGVLKFVVMLVVKLIQKLWEFATQPLKLIDFILTTLISLPAFFLRSLLLLPIFWGKVMKKLIDLVFSGFSAIGKKINWVINSILSFLSDPQGFIKKIKDGITDALASASQAFVNVIRNTSTYFDGIMDKIGFYFGSAIDLLVDSLNPRNLVSGNSLLSKGYTIGNIAQVKEAAKARGEDTTKAVEAIIKNDYSSLRDQTLVRALKEFKETKDVNPEAQSAPLLQSILNTLRTQNSASVIVGQPIPQARTA